MGGGCCERRVFGAEGWPGGSSLRSFSVSRPSAPLPVPAKDAYLFAHRRRKLWELSGSFHCSLIGTCLSTAELRKLMGRLNPAHARGTDHDLHSVAVGLADRHDAAGKLLTKALDARHAAAVSRFAKARTAEAVRDLWAEAVAAGDIPGPYWAVMTHPDTSPALQREAFGEVHMLSHLVGAANRADIRRLAQLEAENLALAEKVGRQQARLQETVARHDATVQELRQHLVDRAEQAATGMAAPSEAGLHAALEETRRRLDGEVGYRAALERRLDEMRSTLESERRIAADARAQEAALRGEIEAIEASLMPGDGGKSQVQVDLRGVRLLYVGGRPNQSARLRHLAETAGASLLLHDGGVEDAEAQLAGLISRADVALFPVDCVSHDAALTVKRLCRRLEKPFIPLRGTGGTAFLAALHGLAAQPERVP